MNPKLSSFRAEAAGEHQWRLQDNGPPALRLRGLSISLASNDPNPD